MILIHADEFGSSVPESEDGVLLAMHVSQRNSLVHASISCEALSMMYSYKNKYEES